MGEDTPCEDEDEGDGLMIDESPVSRRRNTPGSGVQQRQQVFRGSAATPRQENLRFKLARE